MQRSTQTLDAEIHFNSETFALENPTKVLPIEIRFDGHEIWYRTKSLSRGARQRSQLIKLRYDFIVIVSYDIHHVYCVLQYIMGKQTIQSLYENVEWQYEKWSFEITSDNKLPDWARILNCILNPVPGREFNMPFNVDMLDAICKLNDKRGWGGERPREVYYKLGFPFFTSKIKKSWLSNRERIIVCPFPIERINPKRKAIIDEAVMKGIKCFICNIKEGEIDKFGNIVRFEKGHYEAHINGGATRAGVQCKWCNTMCKDKINWNPETGKIVIDNYAIMRDAPKKETIANLKKLGFTPKDLE